MAKSSPLPSQSELLEHLKYDPETGLFWWIKRGKGRQTSKHAGTKGYKSGIPHAIYILFGGKRRKAHRLAWVMTTGDDPGDLTIDHINRDPFDNRLDNLRLADMSLQLRNQRSYGTSLHKGVYFAQTRQKWRAVAWIDGKQKSLGSFLTEADAAIAAAPYYIP